MFFTTFLKKTFFYVLRPHCFNIPIKLFSRFELNFLMKNNFLVYVDDGKNGYDG